MTNQRNTIQILTIILSFIKFQIPFCLLSAFIKFNLSSKYSQYYIFMDEKLYIDIFFFFLNVDVCMYRTLLICKKNIRGHDEK